MSYSSGSGEDANLRLEQGIEPCVAAFTWVLSVPFGNYLHSAMKLSLHAARSSMFPALTWRASGVERITLFPRLRTEMDVGSGEQLGKDQSLAQPVPCETDNFMQRRLA
jgi:hypothetical protein